MRTSGNPPTYYQPCMTSRDLVAVALECVFNFDQPIDADDFVSEDCAMCSRPRDIAFQTTTLSAIRISAADAFWRKPLLPRCYQCRPSNRHLLETTGECFDLGRQEPNRRGLIVS